MRYELYYWPMIQGRGEFVRLALEEAQADYVDVARSRKNGMDRMRKLMAIADRPPFAPPFLKAGKLTIAQTAEILHFLGPRLDLAPKNEAARLWLHQVELTVMDCVKEAHDTHHPMGTMLYYEQQRAEAKRFTKLFWDHRAPKYLGYFERLLDGGPYVGGRRLSYVDLSLFQLMAGLRFAFPKRMARLEKKLPHLASLHDRVVERPRIAAYLQSKRRIPFNEHGIFRYYKELDK